MGVIRRESSHTGMTGHIVGFHIECANERDSSFVLLKRRKFLAFKAGVICKEQPWGTGKEACQAVTREEVRDERPGRLYEEE